MDGRPTERHVLVCGSPFRNRPALVSLLPCQLGGESFHVASILAFPDGGRGLVESVQRRMKKAASCAGGLLTNIEWGNLRWSATLYYLGREKNSICCRN